MKVWLGSRCLYLWRIHMKSRKLVGKERKNDWTDLIDRTVCKRRVMRALYHFSSIIQRTNKGNNGYCYSLSSFFANSGNDKPLAIGKKTFDNCFTSIETSLSFHSICTLGHQRPITNTNSLCLRQFKVMFHHGNQNLSRNHFFFRWIYSLQILVIDWFFLNVMDDQ